MSTAIRMGLAVRSRWVMANLDREMRSPEPIALISLLDVRTRKREARYIYFAPRRSHDEYYGEMNLPRNPHWDKNYQ